MGRRRTDAIRVVVVAAAVGGLVTALALIGLGAAAGVELARVGGGATAAADVRAIYRDASPAVVAVSADGRTGSGFLIDGDDHVVTNAHVVGDEDEVVVSLGGRRVGAHVRGVEPSVDLAVLELDVPAGDVRPLAFAESAGLRVGDPVVAIGAPFGLQGSLSSGIVSGLRRQIDSPNGFAITGVIQTDAALNPGNSGGPVLDLSGRVIGVATQIATEGGRNEGIGFAVPSDVVRRTALAIIDTGRAGLPYLGIVGQDVPDGVRLEGVLSSGPATGILRREDVIVSLDGAPVASNAGLAAELAGHGPGDVVEVGVRRGDRTIELRVTLIPRPAEGP
ncbi:MAG: trypsin-like peptidase domain-containing protein [Thermoleophilia bacterium]|nr:trypsin-like peptidase domain-containing protein [Thermoleophilia bacterium]